MILVFLELEDLLGHMLLLIHGLCDVHFGAQFSLAFRYSVEFQMVKGARKMTGEQSIRWCHWCCLVWELEPVSGRGETKETVKSRKFKGPKLWPSNPWI